MIFSAVSGGSVAPFAKVALEAFPPFTLVFLRFLAASVVLLPFVYRNRELSRQTLRKLWGVAAIGALNPILLFIALQFTPSSVSPLIYASIPMMTAIYLQSFRGRKIPAGKMAGIVVGFAGVAIIILLPFFEKGDVDLKSVWGNVLILGAAVAFMFYGILSNDKQQEAGISPLALTFYFCIVTLAVSLPFSVYEVASRPLQPGTIQLKHIFSALEIGIAGTSLFYLAYQKAIQQGNELTASLFTYLQPIATILLSVALLGEAITAPFVIGGALAIVGARLGR